MKWILRSLHYIKVHQYLFLIIFAIVLMSTIYTSKFISKLLSNVLYVLLLQTDDKTSSAFSISYFITNDTPIEGSAIRFIKPPILEQLWSWSEEYNQESSQRSLLEGQLLLFSGDFQSANSVIENSLSATGNEAYAAGFYLGLSYELMGEHEKAVEIWRSMPETGLYFLVNGRDQLEKSKNPHIALKYLEIATAITPKSCEALYYHGNALTQLDQPQEALAIWSYPNDLTCSDDYFLGEIYFQRATLLQSLEQTDKALHDLRRALALDPQNIKRLVRLANLLSDNGDNLEAQAYFSKIIEIDPDELWGYLGFCNLERRNRNYAASLRWCQEALTQFPHNSTVYFHMGLIYQDMGNLPEAISWFEKMVNEGEPTVLMWVQLGDTYLAAGETENATAAYETAVKLDPSNNYAMQKWAELKD